MFLRTAVRFLTVLPGNSLQLPKCIFNFSSHQRVRFLSDAVSNSARVTFDKAGAALFTLPMADGQLRRFVVNNDAQTTLAVLAASIQKEGVTNGPVMFQSAGDGVRLAELSPAWQVLSGQPIQLLFDGKSLNVDVAGEPHVPVSSASDSAESLSLLESSLSKRAETLRGELEPLDVKVQSMLQTSHRRTRAMAWVGLAFMATQFGFLARLTWWDYSWDIVEPITYFVTYGTGMFFYSYYVVTRQEANFAEMFDRQHLITMHKRLAKAKFDLSKYNKLRDDLHEVETQLANLRQSVDWQVHNNIKTTAS